MSVAERRWAAGGLTPSLTSAAGAQGYVRLME